ncbi:hypothetical protein CKO44_10335 [Rubrivivax gelatinosus]|uniref:hypothetical protein n=1 Tax=Rubrivivax gelatinosus TaxID=28068 RepID=UPI001904D7AA|nr:hypothetical protein [Rubrivivax gelatinosus]MBK1613866.1 hypothetical protein [Rubrivivax gelatinosus]MBZ8143485.1 hypothetical protein [Rubrivivax gelatinosus]
MSRYRRCVASVLLCATAAAVAARADTTIVILRHAEKPPLGLGQLDCRGLNRALALPAVLLRTYGAPSALYAPDPSVLKADKGVPYAYIRPLATIEPLAVRAGLPVQLHWSMEQVEPLAAHLLAQPAGTYVVAWEHHWAARLARALVAGAGGDAARVPGWADDDFDSLYEVRLRRGEGGTTTAEFSIGHEGLDGQSSTCPAPAGR